jgi:acetyl-CoA C-acetyltransferase
MSVEPNGFVATWENVFLVDGVRTPFVDLAGALSEVSPIDLGIKAGREAIRRADLPAQDINCVVAGSMAQASFDAYMLPRHIGLYCGAPLQTPAHLVQRVCGTGIEAISQAADALTLGRASLVLCVGAESMSRNPVAAYTHRNGFKMGQVEFKDFLWEALFDPSCRATMGHTAENLAERYAITRAEVDAYAARSFDRALAAQRSGFLAGEVTPVTEEVFALEGFADRGVKLPRGVKEAAVDTHIRSSSVEALAKIRPAFGGVQTGGNSSGVVDGAAAALVATGDYLKSRDKTALARVHACAVVGVEPNVMGIGPAPAIRNLLARVGLPLSAIDRIEINEAFGAQVMACSRELGLDESKLNVNGGAIAIGHPLAATGLRLAITVSRQLKDSGLRWGIASACIGGGQGIAMLLENPTASGR